jgi:hypothetical protein
MVKNVLHIHNLSSDKIEVFKLPRLPVTAYANMIKDIRHHQSNISFQFLISLVNMVSIESRERRPSTYATLAQTSNKVGDTSQGLR